MNVWMRSLPYAAAFVMPLVSGAAILVGGQALWLPPLFLFVLTPAMDQLMGLKREVLEGDDALRRPRDLRYDLWLYAWVPVQLMLQGMALLLAAQADFWSFMGLAFAAGMLGGIGINVGHELMHRRGVPERALAEVLLTSVSYTHFCVEHVLGHHRHVSTALDPASARLGEPLQTFWVRSIVGGVRSAWRLERSRVTKLRIPLGLRDRRVRYPLVLAGLVTAIAAAGGAPALVLFALQSLVAVLLLETINYLEHYGLQRAQALDGSFERVAPRHSWSSAHRLTSLYLFNLTRHADHHANASRPYWALRHLEEGPTLPFGYASMLVLALCPPLWRRVVDPHVPTNPADPQAA
jgi:alkane 1-monooxygenase